MRRRAWSLCLCVVFGSTAGPADTPARQRWTDDISEYAEAWCAQNRKTPEPRVVVYNRLPKAGSTTMISIIKDQVKQNRQIQVQGCDKCDASKMQEQLSKNEGLHPRARRFVVIGHNLEWRGLGAAFENLQLFRACSERCKSNLAWVLPNNPAHLTGPPTKQTLASDARARACLGNATCFREARQDRQFARVALKYMGAANATEALRALLEQYAAFGFIERLRESLELFECVFPSVFRGAASAAHTHEHQNKAPGPARVSWTREVSRAIDAQCREEESFLSPAREVFSALHRRARENKSACCRRP